MERRLTGFLIPILIATLVFLLFFGPEDKKQGPSPATDPALRDPVVQKAVQEAIANQPPHEFEPVQPVTHVFGALPSRGAKGHGFQVSWSRYGAGIRSVLLNDHFVTPASADKAEAAPETLETRDFYAIVPAYPPFADGSRSWGYGLVLEGRGAHRFAKAIDDGPKHQLWEVTPPAPGADEVTFALDMGDGLVLEKVYRYVPEHRDLELSIRLRCAGDPPAAAPRAYDLSLRGVHLWNPRRERVFSNPATAIGAMLDAERGELPFALPAADATKRLFDLPPNHTFSFAGTTNRFFGGFLFPADAATTAAVHSVDTAHWPPVEMRVRGRRDDKTEEFIIEPGSVPEVRCNVSLAVPAKGEVSSLDFRLYLGPKSTTVFAEQPGYARFDVVADKDLDPVGCCCTIPGVVFLAKAITWTLRAFQSVCGNWGVAIIMLTLLVRVLLSPLNFNMQRTMRAHGAKMAELKPQLDMIQKQYKDDPKKLQMEMMRFNKEHKLITAPLKGCLPILVTMPIWFGLFSALRVMYDLRHQPFVGWIDDLSTPDRLFELGLPFVPYFNLLPILMVALWLYLQMGTPLPKDPQQRQMMIMMRFMPVMMGVMLYNYASGLMVYMCTSSVWGIVEQKATKRILGPVNPDSGMNVPTMV